MSDIENLFVDCSKQVAQSFRDAAHNVRSLQRKGTNFKQINPQGLFDRLCSHKIEGAGAKFVGTLNYDQIFTPITTETFCQELDGRKDLPVKFITILHVNGQQELAPNILRNMFELNTAAFLSNLCIDALARRDKSQDWQSIAGTACDAVMYQASILESSFVHAANLTQHPHIRPYLLSLIGMVTGENLQPANRASAEQHFMECLEAFNAATPRVGDHLMKNAFDANQLRARIGKSPAAFTTIPIWFPLGFIKGQDKFVNDVWLPTPWAEPIMTSIIEGQAEALRAAKV